MASGNADIEIKVGADFTELKNAVAQAKTALNNLGTAHAKLEADVKHGATALSTIDKEIRGVRKSIAKLNSETSKETAETRRLNAELKKLQATRKHTSDILTQNKFLLSASTNELEKHSKKTAKASSASRKFAGSSKRVFGGLRGIAQLIPGLGLIGLAALIAGPLIGAFTDWIWAAGRVTEAQKAMQKAIDDSVSNFAEESTSVIKLVSVLRTETETRERKLAALKELKRISPEHFKNLRLEKGLVNGLTGAVRAYNQTVFKRIQLAAQETILQRNVERQLEIKQQFENKGSELNELRAKGQKQLLESEKSTLAKLKVLRRPGGPEILNEGAKKLILAPALVEAEKKARALGEELISVNATINAMITKIRNSDIKLKIGLEPPGQEVKKQAESITTVLLALRQRLADLSEFEIIFKTSKTQEKINAIENAIKKLVTDFNVTATADIVIKLNAEAAKLKAKDLIKFPPNTEIEIPTEFKIPEDAVQPPTIDWAKVFKREDLIKELKDLGVTKTISGQFVDFAFIDDLIATLDSVNAKLQQQATFIAGLLGPAFDALFNTIGTRGVDAFTAFSQAIGNALKQLAATVIKAAALAAIMSAITGKGFGSIFTSLIGFKDGGIVGGHADGGYISGPGSGRSDSIPARLSNGEYVIRANAVRRFGKDFFDKINFGMSMPSTIKNRFADGGMVKGNSVAIQSSGVFVTGELKLRNEVLVAAVRRGQKTNTRHGL